MKKSDELVPEDSKPAESVCTEDLTKSNPAVHLLYVKWGVKHLAIIEGCILKLSNLSNTNMMDIICAMQAEYDKLIATNQAYKDAKEILDSIRGTKIFPREKKE